MKKLLLVLLPAFLLALTGCGPSAYEQFHEETLDLQNSSAVLIETDFSGYEGVEISFDLESKIMKMDFTDNGYVGYFAEGLMYVQVGKMWTYGYFSDPAINEMFDLFGDSSSVFEFLPTTDEMFAKDYFGLPLIDDAVALKKPQDVLVKTDENTYTIKGIEEQITITTVDGVVKVNIDNEGKENSITFTAADPIEVPAEAKEGMDIGTF